MQFRRYVMVALLAACSSEVETSGGDERSLETSAPTAWFVQLRGAPIADGGTPAAIDSARKAFRDEARRAGVGYIERRAFGTLWNGLSVQVTSDQLARLRQLDTVELVFPVLEVEAPQSTMVSDPNLVTALAMTGADVVQSELGFTGQGIRVGIIDSGIDYHHADLGGCFGPGCRVVRGHDFVGDAFNAATGAPPVADPDPDDCLGHGTHVAGIVGANGDVKGVAPDVTFHAYRVFGCAGPTTSDVMIQAMEMAHADGVQVVNMSIGSAFQSWPQYPTAAAADRLVKRGVVVVASIGNSGVSGLYAAGAPGVGDLTIGVGMLDNSHIQRPAFRVGERLVGYAQATAAPLAPVSGTLPIQSTSATTTTTNDACAPLPAGSLVGKAALIRRFGCSFHVKALNAQNAGASAVIFYNNVPGFLSPTVAGTPAITIPVVMLTAADGQYVFDNQSLGLEWTEEQTSVPLSTASLLNPDSSYGPTAELVLKPDVSAPGGFIYSTLPLEQGGHGVLTGTSMASPHVAGAAALLLQARPNIKPAEVRERLQNTAQPVLWAGNPSLGVTDVVHRQGAGRIQIDRAIESTTLVSPSKLSLGESEFGPVSRTLTITNTSAAAKTFTISHQASLATGPSTFVPSFINAPASVTLDAQTVVVEPGASAAVAVTIAPNAALAPKSLYGGWIVATAAETNEVVRVPYLGFAGDYQSIVAVTPTVLNFPWLARSPSPNSITRQPAETVFGLTSSSDVPVVAVHLDHQVRRVRGEVYVAPDVPGGPLGTYWQRAFDAEYVGRASSGIGVVMFPFNGTTKNGSSKVVRTVPDGRYVLKLMVLKALGDDTNPNHWETWTSVPFIIDRP